jgi:hypothetical protein
MAQAMADGLARKARLGLSDEDVRREMLDRFRLQSLIAYGDGMYLRGVQRDMVGMVKRQLVAATDKEPYRITSVSVDVGGDEPEPWRTIRITDRTDHALAYVEMGPVPADDPAYREGAARRDANTTVISMFAAEAVVLLPCGPVMVNVAAAIGEGFASEGWDRLLPDGKP